MAGRGAERARAGRTRQAHVPHRPALPGLGLWLEQLVAESTGKHGTGILPVAEEPPGEPGAYGDDRVFMPPARRRGGEAELERVRASPLRGIPFSRAHARPADLGRVFLLAELAVAVAGWGLEINPFDQPNVQQAKDATNRVLAGYESDGTAARRSPTPTRTRSAR